MPPSTGSPRLAVLGGAPAFAEPLHVGRPNLGPRDALLRRVDAALDRRWLSNNGPLVQEFERRVAELLGVRHCVATCNGTVALELATRALGLSGEVIVPAFTFVATVHALHWLGLTPVFCDIDPRTHNLDPEQVAACITPRTTGIIGVHVWGRACDVAALQQLADRHGLALLFDAAHAFACSHRGTMIGNFGAAEVFSFHATKIVHCGEGGAVVTNDDELARRLRLLRNFGFAGYDRVVSAGTNGKLSELSAALGLTSLDGLDEFVAANRRNHDRYAAELSGLPGLSLLSFEPDEQSNYQYLVVDVDERQSPLTRDELVQVLHAENVLARRYFHPGCHNMEPYRTLYPDAGSRLPITAQVCRRVLQLPTGTAVGEGHIRAVCAILRRALAAAREVRQALQAAGRAPDS
jgi:dTDP-4-amino-4,6-dideoxygalactose transaminase